MTPSEASGAASEPVLSDGGIEALVEQRKAAKAARNYEADRIRAELKAQGIEMADKPGAVNVWLRS